MNVFIKLFFCFLILLVSLVLIKFILLYLDDLRYEKEGRHAYLSDKQIADITKYVDEIYEYRLNLGLYEEIDCYTRDYDIIMSALKHYRDGGFYEI